MIELTPAHVWKPIESLYRGLYGTFFEAVVFAHDGVPVTVTSYYRSPERNRQVGGHPDSQHLLGLALDTVYPDDASKVLAHDRMERAGLVVVDEGDHLHTQLLSAGIARTAGLFDLIGLGRVV